MSNHRISVKGKFLFIGDEKFFVRGVTYGTFRPQEDGNQFPKPEIVDRDFQLMKDNNINCVRVYTVPPVWLLDCALKHGLKVMVGMPYNASLNSDHWLR